MSENTKIEWCDHTFNPWEGCQKVGPGCDHCYAETRNARFSGGQAANWGPGAPRRRTSDANWRKPQAWNKQAYWQCPCGWRGTEREMQPWDDGFGAWASCPRCHRGAFSATRARVFCASLADVFDNQVPEVWRRDLFKLIAETPDLDWLLLTKRIGNAGDMIANALLQQPGLESHVPRWPWPNIWLGATITSKEEACRDIPKLLAVPAKVRFLSMEPLLGPVSFEGMFANPADVRDGTNALEALDWVIVGGESGPGARPMHTAWARSMRDQCQAAGVPFLFKQWGEWLPWHHFGCAGVDDPPEQTKFKTMEFIAGEWIDVGYPDCWASKDGEIDDMQCVGRVGKKAAGRLLDGVEHNGFPEGA